MGRGVIDLPMDEIASFIVLPETTSLYDKYNVVRCSNIVYCSNLYQRTRITVVTLCIVVV